MQGIGLRQRDAFPKGAFKAFPEIGGGAAGKGNGKDALSGDAVLEEALDAAHKGAGFAGTGAREYQHGVWPGLDGFLLRFGIRERLRIGRRLRCRGRHCREQGYLFRCRFLGRCRFGFSARFLGFGQSIQQGGRTIPSGHKLFALFFREHFDDPVFAVKARFLDDVAPAHTGHGLAEGVPVLTQIRLGDRVQDIHFRTEQADQFGLPFLHFSAFGADGKQFAEHFRKREQRDESRIVLGHDRGLAVGQRHDPVEYADGERLAAYRADIPDFHGFFRLKDNIAGAVPVKVVFSFLREELDRPPVDAA